MYHKFEYSASSSVPVHDKHLLPSVGEFVKGVFGDDVTADELHGWVTLRRLLPQDGTRKHRVIPALLS